MDKTRVDFGDSAEKALERYVNDQDNKTLSRDEVVAGVGLKRALPADKLLPKILPGMPISSIRMTEYIRETKLRLNLLGSQSSRLGTEVDSAAGDFWSTLDDIQAETRALDSDIQEEEVKAEDKFTQVHYNAFNRPIDMQSFGAQEVDWKTGLPFLKGQHLAVLPGAGLTLPIVNQEKVLIREIQLVHESTDVGDSPVPIIATDPSNLLDPDKTFRYVIARKIYDDTGRLYNYTESRCTLLLQLPHIQLLNHIHIRPASHSPIFVTSVAYINNSGQRVELDVDVLSLDNSLTILLEPIRASHLYITMTQYAPVEQTTVFTGDFVKTKLNELLNGANWSNVLDADGVDIKAKVFDFSLEALKLSLLSYGQTGYFISQPINVEKPISFNLSVDTETIKIASEQLAYGTNYFLPDDTVLYETYLKLRLGDDISQKQVDALFPIPSTKQSQTEMLPIIGGESRTCFVPDIFFGAFKRRAEYVLYAGTIAIVELEEPHGISQGIIYTDELELWVSREDPDKNFVSVYWSALSPTMLVLLRNDGVTLTTSISRNTTPKARVLRYAEVEPLALYEEGTKLELGEDYLYSLDSGVTYLDHWALMSEYATYREAIFAGSFRFKLLDPDYDRYYWCSYRRLNTQYLHPSKLLLLNKNSVILDKRIQGTKGYVQTCIVLRADSRIPYLSSVIHNYKLKVR